MNATGLDADYEMALESSDQQMAVNLVDAE
jgi:hypothetical protein